MNRTRNYDKIILFLSFYKLSQIHLETNYVSDLSTFSFPNSLYLYIAGWMYRFLKIWYWDIPDKICFRHTALITKIVGIISISNFVLKLFKIFIMLTFFYFLKNNFVIFLSIFWRIWVNNMYAYRFTSNFVNFSMSSF